MVHTLTIYRGNVQNRTCPLGLFGTQQREANNERVEKKRPLATHTERALVSKK